MASKKLKERKKIKKKEKSKRRVLAKREVLRKIDKEKKSNLYQNNRGVTIRNSFDRDLFPEPTDLDPKTLNVAKRIKHNLEIIDALQSERDEEEAERERNRQKIEEEKLKNSSDLD